MYRRTDVHADESLQVQALYSIPALARAAHVSPGVLRRLLRERQVEFFKAGRSYFVPLVEIECKLPLLWKSILAAEALRHQNE
jgi:hypothetical protein